MAPVTLASGMVVVGVPTSNVVALAARTLERTVFPPERMDVCLALFGVEEQEGLRPAPTQSRQGALFSASATAEGRQFNGAPSCLQGRYKTTAVAATA